MATLYPLKLAFQAALVPAAAQDGAKDSGGLRDCVPSTGA